MSKAKLELSTVRRKMRDIRKRVDRRYRRLAVRNMVLAMQSRERTSRFVSGGNRFVLFLVPGMDLVNGGVMSICSIASETGRLLQEHGVSVAVCTAYHEPRMLRYTKFENDIDILSFSDLLPRFPLGSDVLVHIPEMFVKAFVSDCPSLYRTRADLHWRFNILLQNIDLIPSKQAIEAIQAIGPTTATTAHKASTSAAHQLGCPVHYLSWGLYPEKFECADYSGKQKLIAISPDPHPAKAGIVRRMSETMPDYRIIEIRNMSYEEYKRVIRTAKFMFTFGEGLDGYFVESIFSGSIAMALFNTRFFTPEYDGLDGVFPNPEHALAQVHEFMMSADSEAAYRAIAERQHKLVAKDFNREKFVGNIRSFYEQYYLA